MIKHNSSVLEQADIEGRSALMWAAGKGANSVIKTLLKLIHFDNAIENSFDEATSGLLLFFSNAPVRFNNLENVVFFSKFSRASRLVCFPSRSEDNI